MLEHAAELLPAESIERVRCLLTLAEAVAVTAGDEHAIEIADEAAQRAEALGEEGLAWQARVVSAASQQVSVGSFATALEQGREAVEACARLGDALAEARAHKFVSTTLSATSGAMPRASPRPSAGRRRRIGRGTQCSRAAARWEALPP